MPVLSSALDELTAMVKATWTDVTTIGRATQSVRQNWQNAIETLQAQGSDKLPWCVIDLDPGSPADHCSADSEARYYEIGIWYITQARQETSSHNGNILGLVNARCEALAEAMYTPGAVTALQILQVPTIDTSRLNEVNREMLGTKIPILAGSVNVRALMGQVLSV